MVTYRRVGCQARRSLGITRVQAGGSASTIRLRNVRQGQGMAHKLETAHISFGLVTIPVGIYSAIQEQDIHFNQLHAACGSRIKQQRFCPVCKREVPYDELVKGYEVA